MYVLQFQSLSISLLLKVMNKMLRDSTLCSCSLVSDFVWVSMRSLFPSRRDFATFAGPENLKIGSVLHKTSTGCSLAESASWLNLLWRENNATDSTIPTDFTHWDELDIRLSFQSANFAIAPNLLLAPEGTVVKPSRARICSSSKSASWGVSLISGIWLYSVECSISCSVTIGIGCRTKFWHDPQFR